MFRSIQNTSLHNLVDLNQMHMHICDELKLNLLTDSSHFSRHQEKFPKAMYDNQFQVIDNFISYLLP